jgi:hypothetical protein
MSGLQEYFECALKCGLYRPLQGRFDLHASS